jgi:hypothetical protein
MKLLSIITALLLGLILADTASAASHPTVMGCTARPFEMWPGGDTFNLKPVVKPKTCNADFEWVDEAGMPTEEATAGKLRQLTWTHWGVKRADGRGQDESGNRVHIMLYSPKAIFSERAFSRMRVSWPGLSQVPAARYTLPWGYDLWPLL